MYRDRLRLGALEGEVVDFYTYEGKITFPDQAPSLRSIAVSLSRECRYAGAGLHWWPVALHTFVVCDLLPDNLKIYGLLHDAEECVTGDIPKPAKTLDIEQLGQKLRKSIYNQLDIPMPQLDEILQIHVADQRALYGEVHTVGTESLRTLYPRDIQVETLVWEYLMNYKPLECIDPDGPCVKEFMRRFDVYNRMAL